jgi:hypothetical protein
MFKILRSWTVFVPLRLSFITRSPAAFSAGFFGFFAAPLMGYSLHMCSSSALAGDLSLALRTHCGKATPGFLSFMVCCFHTLLVFNG